MRNNRLSDDDITALLAGTALHGRPDLQPLAMLVDDLRSASSESSPRPSAAVTTLLDLDRVPGISTAALGGLAQRSDRGRVPAGPAAASRRGIASMFLTWFTGLGLVAKLGIGAAAAAVGVVGAGAAHALPPGIQAGFDTVVETVVPLPADDVSTTDDDDTGTDGTAPTGDAVADTETDDSGADGVGGVDGTADAGPKTEHAQGVVEAAHDDSTVGREHGEAVSEAAHQNRGQGGSGDDSAEDSGDEVEDEGADDSGTSNSGSGNGNSGSGSANSGRGGRD
ncbi:hypothetical protein [Naasia sp. SYSU D00948]|uniref:hypothetical protein n=1 Tax=Naasia sp. SYSU D00948 TaxID=2817379 RepID=UPI001B317777|nr:hypothetical protein [Naasia sp. SYSU D00948]